MTQELRFDGRVAIVTGAGGGLGRSHALLLGKRGARVVVNDLGGSMHGGGQSATPAQKVVEEIKASGGDAIANYDSVEDGGKIVQAALDTWGRIDIVVNNAGILRDTSFQKLTEEDWDLIYRVHVLGGFRVTRAAWNAMRDAGYGRVIFTASAAGIYGNFGQANYSAAKLGLVGLSNTLAIEGLGSCNVQVPTRIAPIAGFAAWTERTWCSSPGARRRAPARPEYVSPLVAWLCHESCTETGGLFEVGGGTFTKLRWERTLGKSFPAGKSIAPEAVAAAWPDITSFDRSEHPSDITSSMQPVLSNLEKKSRGGNEFIDVDAALGYEFPPLGTSYTERDLALYALGVGAGTDPLDSKDLQYVYELHGDGFRPLPTYAVVPVINAILEQAKQGKQAPGLHYGFERILHGEQYTEVKRSLPPSQKLVQQVAHQGHLGHGQERGRRHRDQELRRGRSRARVQRDRDGRARRRRLGRRARAGRRREHAPPLAARPQRRALPQTPGRSRTWTTPSSSRRSATARPCSTACPATGTRCTPIRPSAQGFGFPRPILHGLCTFGFAARHVIKTFSKNDARYFKSIRARFAESVFPGETLVTEMWKASDTRVVFRTRIKERDKLAISNAAVELYHTEIPAVKAAPAPAALPRRGRGCPRPRPRRRRTSSRPPTSSSRSATTSRRRRISSAR